MPVLRNLLFVLVAVGGGSLAGSQIRGDCLCGTPADEFAAERAGLEREWILQLPFAASTSRVEQVVVGDGLVVAQTGDGKVHAVQAADARAGEPRAGSLLWSYPVGDGGGPAFRAGIGPALVAVAHDKDLYGIDRGTGQLRWQERFGTLTEAGPAVSGSWIYVPDAPDSMMRLPANPYRAGPRAELPAKSDTKDKKKSARSAKKKAGGKDDDKQSAERLLPISLDTAGRVHQQPQPLNGGVLWCTDEGTLVAIEPSTEGWQRNEFYLEQPPAGRPLVHDHAIFAATAEGDLVRIDTLELQGGGLRLTWRVFLDAPPEADLFVSGDRVVVSLGEEGLAAYSAETGEHLWSTWFPGRIVAVSGSRVWIFDRVGRLSSLDAATGERRERFCLGSFSFPVVNQATDRLILASPRGVLMSLKPIGKTTPPASRPPAPKEPG
ncbi:MAG: PQQ-binding-like beta-propeller repeat protein [Planctomycetota bacterium]